MTQDNQQLRQELLTKDGTLEARQRENQQLRQELLTKDGTLEARQRENQQLRRELLTKERENQQLQRTVQDKDRQLRANEQVTAEFQQNLIQREQTIRGLEETITRLGQGPEEAVKGKHHVRMPLQQPKQQLQAVAQTAKSQKHPKQEPSLPTPPRGVQRGAAAADGEST